MNYLKMLAAIGLFVIGVPGLLDDVVQWQDWMNLASWWNVVLMTIGLALFIHGAFKWNLREQLSRIWAYLIGLITVPEWMAEARDKQSFKLYELACLIAQVKPSWPLPSDEAMSVYKQILQNLPDEVVSKGVSERRQNVRDIELNRRQARPACRMAIGSLLIIVVGERNIRGLYRNNSTKQYRMTERMKTTGN